MIDVSVVITTKNEERNIARCLDSVVNQSYPVNKIEIIVVDNNSTDKTVEIAKKYNCQIYTYGPERSAQRNLAGQKAKGEFILFLDADMAISSGLILECLDKCKKDGLGALYIPEIIVGEGFWIKARNFERSFYNATVIDCVRFTRSDVFIYLKGFDESLSGPEDWDFDRRVRGRCKTGIVKSPLYHDEGRFNLRKYLKKKTYYAQSFKNYIKKWGISDPVIKKQFGFFYRFIGIFLGKGGWIRLVCHPLLTLGMYFLRVSIGFTYLIKTE